MHSIVKISAACGFGTLMVLLVTWTMVFPDTVWINTPDTASVLDFDDLLEIVTMDDGGNLQETGVDESCNLDTTSIDAAVRPW